MLFGKDVTLFDGKACVCIWITRVSLLSICLLDFRAAPGSTLSTGPGSESSASRGKGFSSSSTRRSMWVSSWELLKLRERSLCPVADDLCITSAWHTRERKDRITGWGWALGRPARGARPQGVPAARGGWAAWERPKRRADGLLGRWRP